MWCVVINAAIRIAPTRVITAIPVNIDIYVVLKLLHQSLSLWRSLALQRNPNCRSSFFLYKSFDFSVYEEKIDNKWDKYWNTFNISTEKSAFSSSITVWTYFFKKRKQMQHLAWKVGIKVSNSWTILNSNVKYLINENFLNSFRKSKLFKH